MKLSFTDKGKFVGGKNGHVNRNLLLDMLILSSLLSVQVKLFYSMCYKTSELVPEQVMFI